MEWLARKASAVQAQAQNLPSPCISVCRMEPSTGLCKGCLRTLDEISAWSTLDDAGKRSIWARIEARATAQGVNP
ncbi:MAG: DUF1289 domain-containing protein [Burkholderiales bacterium]|nr:DUF1289 domain-containing protein [Burkholderiales bacterium]